MHELLLNIDNKEILIEILHHAVDFMIDYGKDAKTRKITKTSHKYGFSNPEDFESAIKFVAKVYKLYCLNKLTDTELISNFVHMNQDLQQSVVDVVKARKNEICEYLLREFNSQNNKLLISFDWDIRFIMGNSSLTSYRTQIATIIFNCLEKNGSSSKIHFEVNRNMLDKLIKVLEECNTKLHEVDSSEGIVKSKENSKEIVTKNGEKKGSNGNTNIKMTNKIEELGN